MATHAGTIPRLVAPGLLGSLPAFRASRLDFQLAAMREHADIARVRLGPFEVLLVGAPELVHALLVSQADDFVKSYGLSLFARPILGDGLLTSEHALHKRQRRLIAPAFGKRQIAEYAALMGERAEQSLARMLAAGELDISAETMRVTLEIVGKTLTPPSMGMARRVVRSTSAQVQGAPQTVLTEVGYDSVGRVSSMGVPHFAGTPSPAYHRYQYDSWGRLAMEEHPWINEQDGVQYALTEHTWSSRTITGGCDLGIPSRCDALRRGVWGHTVTQGQRTSSSYWDAAGRQVGTLVGDTLSTFIYGGFDRLRFVSPAEGAGLQEFQYDGLGRTVLHKDPDLNSEEQTLVDGFGRMRGYQRNGRTVAYLYDGLGRRTGEVTPDGVYTRTYDGTRPEDVGHLVRESFTSSSIGTNSTTYEHGGPDSAVSRIDRVIEGETLSTTLNYDGRGRLRGVGYPALAGQPFEVEYSYNAYGQPETVFEPGGGTVFWRHLEASPFGGTSRSRLGNGMVQLLTPNPVNGLPAAMSAGLEQGPVVVKSDALRYDDRSLLASRTTQGGPPERFVHDDFGRLHEHHVGTEIRGYDYNPRGNLTGKWDLGVLRYEDPLLPTAVTSTAAGHDLDYDAEGRLVVRNEDDDPALRVELDYTEFDLPREIRIGPDNAPTETYTYRYDAGKRRVAEYRNGALSDVQVGDLWRRSTRNGTTEFVARLAVPDGTSIEVAVVPGQARQVRYMLTDHLGSVTHVLDQSGLVDSRSYQPFGEATTLPTGRTTRLGFTGHENDVAGHVNAKGRIYDPEIGRFLTPDPIVHPFNGQSWNRHSYVLNSPMNLVDPSGWDPSCSPATGCILLDPVIIKVPGDSASGSSADRTKSSSSSSASAWSSSAVGDGLAQANAALQAKLNAIQWDLLRQSQQLALQQIQQGATLVAQVLALYAAGAKTSSASLAPSASAPPSPVATGLGSQHFMSAFYGARGGFDERFRDPRGRMLGILGIARAGAEIGLAGGAAVILLEAGAVEIGTAALGAEVVAARGAAGVADDVAVAASKLCFPAGTPILTPTGWVAIEEIAVGDEVYAFDEESGTVVVRPVEKTFENITDVLVEISYEGGQLAATMSHPFRVEGLGWVAAKDLVPGMRLRTPSGTAEVLRVASSHKEQVVYNFSVADEHNYFAGHAPVLVHNQDISFANYNGAILDAFEWLRGQGVDTSTLTEVRESRIGGGRGLATAGGRAGFRIEWDPRSGAHINAWAGKVKSGHFKFPGNAQSVQSLLRILYCR